MPINTTGSANAICPFYLRESTKSISCEGFAGEACLIRFDSAGARRTWALDHCERYDYGERCPYAKMMEKLYEN
jgi:hypothetical protein